MTINRRKLLQTTAAVGAAISMPAIAYGRIIGAQEKIRCAVIGLNGRGKDHLRGLGKNVVAICDCDQNVLEQQAQRKDVETYTDFRRLLENKNIDAVSIATPNHLHSLIAIEAVMAGKHVYVEKPVSHNVWEGRQLTEAQAKYKRVVQCGTQSRSLTSHQEAVKFVRDGGLGKIQFAIGTCYKPRQSIGKLEKPLVIPSHIDYDLWCGPAEKRPLFRPKLHYDWHWDFNTGNGDMGNQGIHQMDIARWFLGYDTVSPRVLSIGGRLGYDDAGNTPNTQTVIHDYPGAPLIFETRGLPTSRKFQSNGWNRNMDRYRGSQIGVIVQCENGYVVVSGSVKAFDNDGNEIQEWTGGGDHYANFLEAVGSNDQSKLNAPIEEGHLSSALCHTGGVSHQLGKKTTVKDIESALNDESSVFQDSFRRMIAHLGANEIDLGDNKALTMGAELKMNVSSETVTNHEKANQMMAREYRAGFEVPNLQTQPTKAG
jgi:predicted dehydrogenase